MTTCEYDEQLSSASSGVPPRRLNQSEPDGISARATAARRVVEFAQLYLHAESAGLPCEELALALAEAVLRLPKVELAKKVMAGGEFARPAAIGLAQTILRIRGQPGEPFRNSGNV